MVLVLIPRAIKHIHMRRVGNITGERSALSTGKGDRPTGTDINVAKEVSGHPVTAVTNLSG